MVFSTIIFLFRFLPITLALYYLAPAKLKNTVLFLCSLVFYCWGEVRFFPVMVALILINYLSGLAIEHFDAKPALRRFFLLVALVGSLGMLFYFKYANFVLRSANALLGTAFAEIQGIGTLPLGISFYTFQTLSYSIDVYRRDVKAERNIINFGAYVVMFPQLIAGPIVKYRDVSDQLHVYKHRYNLKQIEEGMTLFTFGLAKKVLLADAVGALWTDIIGVADSPSTTFVGLANASTPLVWLGIIAYSLQLYFDFSGYSLMGIGMGKMLGFDFPANFNYPYISASITEFWRRWHMTLSGWFREYVYIPLGGNRKGIARRDANLLLTFLVSGLWHGANWTFLVWGGLHGLCQVAEDHMPAPLRKRKSLPLRIVGVPLTFAIFVTTFTIFRTSSLGNAAAYFAGILHNPGHEVFAQYWLLGLTSKLELLLLLLGIALLVLVDVLHECGLHLRAWVNAAPRPVRWAVYEFAIFAFLLMASFYSNTGFLYARF